MFSIVFVRVTSCVAWHVPWRPRFCFPTSDALLAHERFNLSFRLFSFGSHRVLLRASVGAHGFAPNFGRTSDAPTFLSNVFNAFKYFMDFTFPLSAQATNP